MTCWPRRASATRIPPRWCVISLPLAVLLGLSTLLAIAGVLGVAYGVFRTSAKTNTVELLLTENGVLRERNQRLDGELTRQTQSLDAARAELAALREAVTQRAEVARLVETITTEERSRRQEHAVQETIARDVLGQLRQLTAVWRMNREPGSGEIGK